VGGGGEDWVGLNVIFLWVARMLVLSSIPAKRFLSCCLQ